MSGRVRVRPAIHWRRVEREIVAVDVDGGEYLAVNGSGALLWPALVDGATHEELAARLSEAYGLDEAAATNDVARFVADLERLGVLER